MDDKNIDNNLNLKKEQKLSVHAIMIILFIVVGLGVSYALFAVQKQNSTSITASANCYTVNYTKGQDINGELTLGTDYTSGYSTDIVMYAEPECELLSATLYITTNQDSTMDFSDEALRYTVVVNEEVVSEGHIDGTENQPIYEKFILNTVETTYKVYIWLDSEKEDTTNMESETFGGFIHSDVVLTSNLSEALITATNLGLASNIKKDIPDFSKTSCSSGCDETTVGLYASEDDLGTSYYFRGDVTNNYVKFGKNSNGQDMYWRIIRINGDGTVRMIYMGTDINSDVLTPVGESGFSVDHDDNTYVGYMYGDEGQTTYELTHSNKYDSPIKTFLEGTPENNYTDGWYYENIVATGYHDYVADAIYCNDRSLYNGTGIGTSKTKYGAYGRLWGSNITPTLKCDFENYTNDSFTVNPNLGNGLLRYPIALITADEAVMAGGTGNFSVINPNFYLRTTANTIYWTISSYWTGEMIAVDPSNTFEIFVDHYVDSGYEFLPVISLKADVLNSGNGTKEKPFKIASPALKTLIKLGLSDSIKYDEPDFSKTSCSEGCQETTVGIYEAEDNLGTSYYFRGDVTNNFVKFGKNSNRQDMYWRILRINGDGTVRMIYMGTDINSDVLTSVGESGFSVDSGDNTYVGYMYGDEGQSTYADTHSNKYDSSIKKYLEGTEANNYEDGWYYQNIVATGYHDYVADAIYCNDRSLRSGTGIGDTQTHYGLGTSPTLKCDFEDYTNDSFTVSNTLGNGLLKYPVGLITLDEIEMAGNGDDGIHTLADKTYINYQTNSYFWTMTPSRNFPNYTYVESIIGRNSDEFFLTLDIISYTELGVVPVISLKADVLNRGNGTNTNPFVVE